MKKLLSLTLALMLGMAAFAQNLIFNPLESQADQDAWTLGEDNDILVSPWNNWVIDDIFGVNDYAWTSATIDGEDCNNLLVSPVYNIASVDASGSFSFEVMSVYDGGNDGITVSNKFRVEFSIDGGTSWYWLGSSADAYDMTISSTQDAMTCKIPFSILSSIAGQSIQLRFRIWHLSGTCSDEDGFAVLVVNNVIMRTRGDVYLVQFDPYQGSGEMNYMVTNAGGTFTMPNSSFTAPTGETFAFWQCYNYNITGNYGAEDYFGIFAANAPVQHIENDLYCFAIYDVANNIVRYDVNYNANGGSGTMSSVSCVKGGGHIVLDNAFTAPAGKHFAGWSESADGSTQIVQPGDEIDIDDNQTSITLYAIWADGEEQGGGQQGGGEQGGGQGEGGGEQGGGQGEGGGQGGGTSAINSVSMDNISIYPNPAHNMVRVNGASINSLEVMDLTGRKVLRTEGVNTIDLSGLNNGVYMLRINANEGVAVRKIVKK